MRDENREHVKGVGAKGRLQWFANKMTVSKDAFFFGLTTCALYAIEDTVNFSVYVPCADLAVCGIAGCAKGLDVDKPRNLAKNVTME